MTERIIYLERVGKEFPGPPKTRVLSDVDFQVLGGEFVAITGPSGSGKSTLLNILGLLDSPSEGRYSLLGNDVSTEKEGWRTSVRAQVIGFVFQSFHLIGHLDLVDNVALPLLHLRMPVRERRQMALDALTGVGLAHRTQARPGTLSGGELQRAAVARAIVHSPRLVLCDEPTGNLDSENTEKVLSLLEGAVSPERSVVVVTHDPSVAGHASREIRVVDGRVQAES